MELLKNIKVIELAWLLPGPFCGQILADLGADVIKVERPGKGDYFRELIPGGFETANHNKRSITINLKSDKGIEVLKRLISDADVLLEGFRPGVMNRLGIGYEEMNQVNPRLIYCSISGFGQYGPYCHIPGHDINYLAIGGALSIPGDVVGEPARSGLPIADLASSMYAAISILAAINGRNLSGKGQYIDVSMTDSIVHWSSVRAGMYMVERKSDPTEMYTHLSPLNRVYQTKNGKVAVGMAEDIFWKNFCKAIGREEWAKAPRFVSTGARRLHAEELIEMLTPIFLEKTTEEWEKIFTNNDIPGTSVLSLVEMFSDPHNVARGMFTEIKKEDQKSLLQVNFPAKFLDAGDKHIEPPPEIGQHTKEILKGYGYTKSEIQKLQEIEAI